MNIIEIFFEDLFMSILINVCMFLIGFFYSKKIRFYAAKIMNKLFPGNKEDLTEENILKAIQKCKEAEQKDIDEIRLDYKQKSANAKTGEFFELDTKGIPLSKIFTREDLAREAHIRGSEEITWNHLNNGKTLKSEPLEWSKTEALGEAEVLIQIEEIKKRLDVLELKEVDVTE